MRRMMYKLYPTMSESPSQDCSTYVIMPREYLGVLAEKAVARVLAVAAPAATALAVSD